MLLFIYSYTFIYLYRYCAICLLLYCMLSAWGYYFLYIYILFLFLTSTSIFLRMSELCRQIYSTQLVNPKGEVGIKPISPFLCLFEYCTSAISTATTITFCDIELVWASNLKLLNTLSYLDTIALGFLLHIIHGRLLRIVGNL